LSRIHRVLLPTDLSLCCPNLASTVRMMTECWNVEITLLHVLETRRLFRRGNAMESAMAQLDFIARTGFGGARVNRRVERGVAADRILEYVRENHVDLIVMPARGTSGVKRRPMGHVTEEVLAEAPCHLWLDWATAVPSTPDRMRIQRVCCAIHLDGSAEHVLCEAALCAADLGAALTIVHAVAPEPGRPALLLDAAARERSVRLATMEIDGLRTRLAPAADLQVHMGATGVVVGRVIRDQEAGLLVSGGDRESILAAEWACPVLRVAVPERSVLRAPDPELSAKCA
jgi:nucleotide-binding universal stress UspA family protein